MGGSELLRKGSNWYPHMAMDNVEANKLTAGIMKSTEKIEQLSGRVITASGGMMILFSMLYLHSMGLPLCPIGID